MTATPKERPILFNADMVRAILDGRKTQTRRVMKWQPIAVCIQEYRPDIEAFKLCPYGIPGDRMWVRETIYKSECGKWFARKTYNNCDGIIGPNGDYEVFTKDGLIVKMNVKEDWRQGSHWSISQKKGYEQFNISIHHADQWEENDEDDYWYAAKKWNVEFRKRIPSNHMPLWASRITLEITNVRVERVQDITKDDAKAEGIRQNQTGKYFCGAPHKAHGFPRMHNTAVEAFADLWDSLNAKRGAGWDVNPWVWAIEFKRIAP